MFNKFFDVEEFDYELEKKKFVDNMNFLKSMSVQEITLYKKWEEFNKRYSELGGPSKMGEDYFFYEDEGGLSELEPFSLQIAAELLDSLGKSAAVKLLQKNDPDGDQLRKYSSSYRDIEKKASIGRPELRDMVKRARQYAKRLS